MKKIVPIMQTVILLWDSGVFVNNHNDKWIFMERLNRKWLD